MLESLPLRCRDIRERCVCRELQCADVGDDIPPIVGCDPIAVGIHDSVTVGDDVVEETVRRATKAVGVITRRMGEAPTGDVPVAVSGWSVARRTIDLEFLAATLQGRCRVHRSAGGRWDDSQPPARGLRQWAGTEGDRVGFEWPRRPAIGPECAVGERVVLRLVVHVPYTVLAA